ncbi:MAG: bacterial proteasome activator family protein [Jatrophihabitans sp.]
MSDTNQDPASPPVDSSTERADVESTELVVPENDQNDEDENRNDIDDITGQVEQPAKVMRIGTMIKQLLEEVRQAPLDEAGRKRLREIHESSIQELATGLSADLQAELHRLSLPFGGEIPSEAELRIAQAQLVGWLEGLFHGIQTAVFAQQAVARAQLEEMRRRALPAGGGEGQHVIVGPGGQMIMPPGVRLTPGSPAGPGEPEDDGTGRGQYL